MAGHPFALVEDGTKRAIYFRGNKQYAICTLGGVWKRSFESVADVITPEDLRDFRIATDDELAKIAAETDHLFDAVDRNT